MKNKPKIDEKTMKKLIAEKKKKAATGEKINKDGKN